MITSEQVKGKEYSPLGRLVNHATAKIARAPSSPTIHRSSQVVRHQRPCPLMSEHGRSPLDPTHNDSIKDRIEHSGACYLIYPLLIVVHGSRCTMMMPKIRSLVRFSGQDRKKCSSKVDGESQSVFLLEERSDEDAAESQGGSARKKKKRAASGAGLPPRGYVTMYVGTEEGDAAETRFVVPATYLSMPAFQPVMEKVTEEFGFEQSGGLCVPCGVEEFLEIMRVTEIASDGAGRLKKMTSRRKTAM